MTFDPYKVMKYHIYLLQLENYQLGRFWKLLFGRGWFGGSVQRKELVWTKKAALLFVINQVLILFFAVFLLAKFFELSFIFFWQRLLLFFILVYILDFFTPLFLSVANLLLGPFDFFAKKIIVGRAKSKIKRLPNLKIIGIAGSYGKTTMKEVLGAVLSAQYAVQITPDSVNTPVGIARWVLNKVKDDVQVLIIEMGEHYRGDVKELCAIAQPDFAVVTGINESHLERMKTLDNVTATIFEIVSKSKAGAAIVLNGDDKNVMTRYKEFVWPDHKVIKFQVSSFKSAQFIPEKLVWECEIEDVGSVEINLLGEYALGDIDAAVKIAKSLGVGAEAIKRGIAEIKPVEHRLQPIKSANNILVIDDSYNGNPDGVAEAIEVLSRFSARRKIYITPGLVEMGKASESIHRQIGLQLAKVADIVILINNSVALYIEEGIKSANQPISQSAPRIIWFNSALEAHAALGKILQANDVVLFQNDWGDNYI